MWWKLLGSVAVVLVLLGVVLAYKRRTYRGGKYDGPGET